MNEAEEVRPSSIAGTWYSSDPKLLSEQIDQYLREARLPEFDGKVIAVIAPHAGYRYSGKNAGHAFATLLGQKRELVGGDFTDARALPSRPADERAPRLQHRLWKMSR